MLQSVESSNTSAQAAAVDAKPPFPISHGDNGGATDDLSTNNDPIFATILPTKPTIQLTNTNRIKPTSSVLHPQLFAKAAYYQTAEFPNFKDMVQIFHEAFFSSSKIIKSLLG